MYSREKRMKAIELYIKYDKCAADVIHELGYPDRKSLRSWYKAYLEEQETGVVRDLDSAYTKYSPEQKKAAVEYYLEHGRNLSRTIRALGYPSRGMLSSWCDELAPGTRKMLVAGVKFTQEQKREAVIALCTRIGSVKDVAERYGVTREALYNWKRELLSKEVSATMPKEKEKPLPEDKDALLAEIERLESEIKRLKLETDIWRMAAEIVKKGPGVDPKNLTNKEKAVLVDALRNEHLLKELLDCLGMARSSYFYHRGLALLPDKYAKLRQRIRELFEENNKAYGYRRIHALLAQENIHISEKVVRRIMFKSDLMVVGKKRRRYSSYKGEEMPAADNLIERNFHADAPNVKWLTDITEFAIPAGKIYLSPIIDCFDGLVVSWTIGTSPNAEMVNSMLDRATKTVKGGDVFCRLIFPVFAHSVCSSLPGNFMVDFSSANS